jgi:hypothetical protein
MAKNHNGDINAQRKRDVAAMRPLIELIYQQILKDRRR